MRKPGNDIDIVMFWNVYDDRTSCFRYIFKQCLSGSDMVIQICTRVCIPKVADLDRTSTFRYVLKNSYKFVEYITGHSVSLKALLTMGAKSLFNVKHKKQVIRYSRTRGSMPTTWSLWIKRDKVVQNRLFQCQWPKTLMASIQKRRV